MFRFTGLFSVFFYYVTKMCTFNISFILEQDLYDLYMNFYLIYRHIGYSYHLQFPSNMVIICKKKVIKIHLLTFI